MRCVYVKLASYTPALRLYVRYGARPRLTASALSGAMSGISRLNANAETMGAKAALFMNINAAVRARAPVTARLRVLTSALQGGLMDVMKTNLGPRGTIKMLVSGAGDIKLTKVRRRVAGRAWRPACACAAQPCGG